MKKIAIDSSPLSSGHSARGTGVYTRRLIEYLEIENSDLQIDNFEFSKNLSKLRDYDLIHYPYFDLFYKTLFGKMPVKTVVTVHDVTPLIYPKYYPPGIKGSVNHHFQKMALRQAEAVITVSETSKKDIVRHLNIDNEKIFVTYEAPNFEFSEPSSKANLSVKHKFNLPSKYVLYIGDVNWNKNLINLVRAVKKANLHLVIVGKAAKNDDYDRNHIENKPLAELQESFGSDKSIHMLGFVENSELNSIWDMATIYCMPSLYEGFGLSVVEAFSAKKVVVCSRTQALVEVAGDAAVYFDPKDIDDMSEKILRATKDKGLRALLMKKSEERIKKYSWNTTAKKTLDVYLHVLKNE